MYFLQERVEGDYSQAQGWRFYRLRLVPVQPDALDHRRALGARFDPADIAAPLKTILESIRRHPPHIPVDPETKR